MFTKKIVLLVAFTLFSITGAVLAQPSQKSSLEESILELSKMDRTKERLALLENRLSDCPIAAIEDTVNCAALYYHIANNQESLGMHTEGLQNLRQLEGFGSSLPLKLQIDILTLKGSFYEYLGELSEAKKYLKNAIDLILESQSAEFNSELGQSYNYLSILFARTGDFRSAAIYGENALQLMNPDGTTISQPVVAVEMNLGLFELFMKNYDEALRRFKETHEKHKKLFEFDSLDTGQLMNNMAMCYLETEQLDQALHYYGKSLLIYRENFGESHPAIADVYHGIAQCHLGKEKMDSARLFSMKAQKIFLSNYGEQHPYTSLGHLLIGQIDAAEKKYDDSDDRHSKALVSLNFDKSADDLTGVSSTLYLLDVLESKGKQQLKRGQENDEAQLRLALQTNAMGLGITERIKSEHYEDDSREILFLRQHRLVEASLQCIYELQQLNDSDELLEEAMNLIEKSKANRLLANYQEQELKESNESPDSLILQSKKIAREILSFRQMLQNPSARQDSLQQLIGELNLERNQVLEKIRVEHPDYYRIVYKKDRADLNKIRAYLRNSKSTFLNFFSGEESLFLLALDDKQGKLIRFENTAQINELLSSTLLKLKDPGTIANSTLAEFKSNSSSLFELLFSSQGVQFENNIIVSPDGQFHELAFESLVDPVTANYLVESHPISYEFSGSNFNRVATKKIETICALAPFGGTESEAHGGLPFSGNELDYLAKNWSGTFHSDEQASISNLRICSEGTDALHIATHAVANKEDGEGSALFFSGAGENKLTAAEIYFMDLPLSHVYLSTCESGKGELQKGEGIIGLSHAFFAAGSAAVVSSLWSVNDNSSASISRAYYEELRAGKKKDHALQQSKLAYLKSAEPDFIHPYYWAGFVLTGDRSPVVAATTSSIWLVAFASLFLFAGLLYFVFSSSKRARS